MKKEIITCLMAQAMPMLAAQQALPADTAGIKQGKQLSEVVVVAYGNAPKRNITGAIETVTAKKIALSHSTSFVSALDGVTGVEAFDTNGQPGSTGSVLLRGFSSVNGNNNPLIVLNGAEFFGNMTDINMNDVESISVLKDAAAAALYGNRAANGVILVTTKSGKREAQGLRVSVRQGVVSRGGQRYETMDANSFMEAQWQGYYNSLFTSDDMTPEKAAETVNANIISSYLKYNIYNAADDQIFDNNGKIRNGVTIRPGYLGDLDWTDQLDRSGYRQEYNLSYSQNSQRNTRYLSLGWLDEDGYVKNSSFKRLTGNTALTFKANSWLEGGLQLAGSYQETSRFAQNVGSVDNVFASTLFMGPIYPVHAHNSETGDYLLDEDGNTTYDEGLNRGYLPGNNALWGLALDSRKTRRVSLNANPYVQVNLPYGITAAVKAAFSLTDNRTNNTTNSVFGASKGVGLLSRTNLQQRNYTVTEQLGWDYDWTGGHHTDLMLAHENVNNNVDYTNDSKQSEKTEGNDTPNNYSVIKTLDGYAYSVRTESYLARVRYNYLGRYNVEASLRRDGSSRFSSKTRWGNFYSVGASWIMSDEQWFKNFSGDAVDYLKLRASYGEVGNDRSAQLFAYNSLYSLSTNQGQAASFQAGKLSDNLKWETVRTFNIGLDARLWNRWNISLDFYDKRTHDLIFTENLPLSSGAVKDNVYMDTPSRLINMGNVKNTGIELATDVDIISNKDWKWNVGLTLSHYKNKVLTIPESNRKDGLRPNSYQKIEEGRSMMSWYLPVYAGVNSENGHALYLLNTDKYYLEGIDGMETEGRTMIPVKNQNGMGVINGIWYTDNPTSDYAKLDYCGSALPDVQGSFSTTLNWKGLSLYAQASYSIGGKMYDQGYNTLCEATGTTMKALHKDLTNAWKQSDSKVDANGNPMLVTDKEPIINYTQSQYSNFRSSRFLVDRSYLMLKRVTLSYNLPASLVSKLDLSGITVEVSGENLFMVTARKGLDPRQGYDGFSNAISVYPRQFSLGINVAF